MKVRGDAGFSGIGDRSQYECLRCMRMTCQIHQYFERDTRGKEFKVAGFDFLPYVKESNALSNSADLDQRISDSEPWIPHSNLFVSDSQLFIPDS